jgi:predicted PurR-regulated permease PerM
VAATNDRFAARVFNLVVLALLGYALLRIFQPFFGPILWALLLAFLLFPVNQRLRRAVRGRRGVAALLLTLAVALGIVIPVVVGTVTFAKQAVDLGQGVSQWADQHRIGAVEDVLKLPLIGDTVVWLEKHAALDAAQIQDWLVQATRTAVEFLLLHGRDLLLGALGLFGNLTLTLFVLFFFFRDGDDTARRIQGLLPLDPRRKARLVRHIQDVTRAVVFGTVVTALVQGFLIGIGFWITGLPSPVVFGAVGTISSFIPFVGTSLIWLPAAIYLFAKGVLWKAIFMVIWGALVVGSVDNFLRPALVSGKAEIGTLTVFFGVLGGLATFGMIGLFLGPVILALALALVDFAEEGRAEGSTA